MTHTYIGVDISGDYLHIHDPDAGETRIANVPAPLRRWLAGLGPRPACLVFEATSRCDRLLRSEATAAGVAFARVNPLHGWHFAQSLNRPKTDRTDAAVLAQMGAERRLAPTPEPAPAVQELGQLARRRDQLKRMETQEKNRLAEAAPALVRADIRAVLDVLGRRIARVEAAIRAHLSAHPALKEQAALLSTIPGVGQVTAVTLLAHLPQLGALDRRQVASLGGLAPRAKESGRLKGQRRLGPGRRHVRKSLYMAALSGLRHPHLFGGMATRMRAKNKPGKLIAIAIARKILTIANAILRTGKPFKEA